MFEKLVRQAADWEDWEDFFIISSHFFMFSCHYKKKDVYLPAKRCSMDYKEKAQAYLIQTQEEDDDAAWLDSLCGGWNEDPRTTEEIKRSIRSARLSGVTRKIRPLTDAQRTLVH